MLSRKILAAVAAASLFSFSARAWNLAEPSTAPATPLVATITSVKGAVQVRDDDKSEWRIAKLGMTVPIGGEVRTATKASMSMVLPPEQVITVERVTTMKILDAVSTSTGFHTDLGMEYGRVRYDVEAGGLEHEAVIRSPSSALAVRGSSVEMSDDPFGSSVMLCRGLANATIPGVGGRVLLRKDDGPVSDAGQSPTTQPTANAPQTLPAYVEIQRLDPTACLRINDRSRTVAEFNNNSASISSSRQPGQSEGEIQAINTNSSISGIEPGGHIYTPGNLGGGTDLIGLGGGDVNINPVNPVGEGKLSFVLTWVGDGTTNLGAPALDLTVVSPTGGTFQTQPGGDVVVNDNSKTKGRSTREVPTVGTETIRWTGSCPVGTYGYSVHYVGTGEPATYTVQVSLNDKTISAPFDDTLTELDSDASFTIQVPPADQGTASKAKGKTVKPMTAGVSSPKPKSPPPLVTTGRSVATVKPQVRTGK